MAGFREMAALPAPRPIAVSTEIAEDAHSATVTLMQSQSGSAAVEQGQFAVVALQVFARQQRHAKALAGATVRGAGEATAAAANCSDPVNLLRQLQEPPFPPHATLSPHVFSPVTLGRVTAATSGNSAAPARVMPLTSGCLANGMLTTWLPVVDSEPGSISSPSGDLLQALRAAHEAAKATVDQADRLSVPESEAPTLPSSPFSHAGALLPILDPPLSHLLKLGVCVRALVEAPRALYKRAIAAMSGSGDASSALPSEFGTPGASEPRFVRPSSLPGFQSASLRGSTEQAPAVAVPMPPSWDSAAMDGRSDYFIVDPAIPLPVHHAFAVHTVSLAGTPTSAAPQGPHTIEVEAAAPSASRLLGEWQSRRLATLLVGQSAASVGAPSAPCDLPATTPLTRRSSSGGCGTQLAVRRFLDILPGPVQLPSTSGADDDDDVGEDDPSGSDPVFVQQFLVSFMPRPTLVRGYALTPPSTSGWAVAADASHSALYGRIVHALTCVVNSAPSPPFSRSTPAEITQALVPWLASSGAPLLIAIAHRFSRAISASNTITARFSFEYAQACGGGGGGYLQSLGVAASAEGGGHGRPGLGDGGVDARVEMGDSAWRTPALSPLPALPPAFVRLLQRPITTATTSDASLPSLPPLTLEGCAWEAGLAQLGALPLVAAVDGMLARQGALSPATGPANCGADFGTFADDATLSCSPLLSTPPSGLVRAVAAAELARHKL